MSESAATSKSQTPAASSPKPSRTLKTSYLVLYNLVSATLWLTVLGRVVSILVLMRRTDMVFNTTAEFTKWTQTLAVLEIAHALLGIVRAPVFTTAMQVASRLFVVWAIADQFPFTVADSPAYSTMLLAWSITEVVRYTFFVFLLTGAVPSILQWLRYNTFFVLYPLGIASETYLVYKTSTPAGKRNPVYQYALWAVLALYVPGSYILYTYMITQRRRIMRGKQRAKE